MTTRSEQMLKKRWHCALSLFLDEKMLKDVSKEYGDELDEAVARLIHLIDFCRRQSLTLTPEYATGVLFAILTECVCLKMPSDIEELDDFGVLLSKDAS